jgi:murein L,D-transpeptidase YcbB/YkuD
MRRYSLLAALVAAGLVVLGGGLVIEPAFAQDDPASDADDPNGGGPAPADQDTANPEPAAAPASDAQPSAETEAAAPAEAAPPLPDATPVVAAIRAKLQDSPLAKSANAQDAAALVAFYNARSDPVWITDMGFSSEAQSIIDEVLKADDWGLSSADFQLPDAGDLPDSLDDQALNEIKLDLAILKYARHARGGKPNPEQLSKLYGMTPHLREP